MEESKVKAVNFEEFESLKKRYEIALDAVNELEKKYRRVVEDNVKKEKLIAKMAAQMEGADIIKTDRKIRSIEIYFSEEDESMKVYGKMPGHQPEERDIDGSLSSLQGIVEGYIEVIPLSEDVAMVINEEGKLREMTVNFAFRGDLIVGPVVFVGIDGEEFTNAPSMKRVLDALLR